MSGDLEILVEPSEESSVGNLLQNMEVENSDSIAAMVKSTTLEEVTGNRESAFQQNQQSVTTLQTTAATITLMTGVADDDSSSSEGEEEIDEQKFHSKRNYERDIHHFKNDSNSEQRTNKEQIEVGGNKTIDSGVETISNLGNDSSNQIDSNQLNESNNAKHMDSSQINELYNESIHLNDSSHSDIGPFESSRINESSIADISGNIEIENGNIGSADTLPPDIVSDVETLTKANVSDNIDKDCETGRTKSDTDHAQNDNEVFNDDNEVFNDKNGFDQNYSDRLVQMKQNRFNPFDRDILINEDHFEERKARSLTTDTVWSSASGPLDTSRDRSMSGFSNSSHIVSDDEPITFADLGLSEDHFAQPEGHFGLSTIEELELGIQSCKALIMDAPEHSEKRRSLVDKLVHLRMKLVEAKEGPVIPAEDEKCILGHTFKLKDSQSSKHYCEKCNGVIWGVIQTWYRCTGCGYCCHEKCLNQIIRTCAQVKVAQNPTYIQSICPERGLAAQSYRCSECRTPISYKNGSLEPRQCDYTGNFYCEMCHWNDAMVIPARVLHNWDFEPRKVCRSSRQFLKLMYRKSVMRVQDVNPMLFNYVDELNEVKKLREEILVMKKYFLSCPDALQSKLLLQLKDRQHFVENSDMYSLKDLVNVMEDKLLPELAKVHTSFAQHIKTDCSLCQAKGFICELCDAHEVLFPFDNIAIVCPKCSTVLHRHCYIRKNSRCPKCDRITKRSSERQLDLRSVPVQTC